MVYTDLTRYGTSRLAFLRVEKRFWETPRQMPSPLLRRSALLHILLVALALLAEIGSAWGRVRGCFTGSRSVWPGALHQTVHAHFTCDCGLYVAQDELPRSKSSRGHVPIWHPRRCEAVSLRRCPRRTYPIPRRIQSASRPPAPAPQESRAQQTSCGDGRGSRGNSRDRLVPRGLTAACPPSARAARSR